MKNPYQQANSGGKYKRHNETGLERHLIKPQPEHERHAATTNSVIVHCCPEKGLHKTFSGQPVKKMGSSLGNLKFQNINKTPG